MMIYLHKILPWFLSPIAVVIALFLAGMIFNSRNLLWFSFAFFIILSNPIIANHMFAELESPFKPQSATLTTKADAVVVLSGILSSISTPDGVVTEWSDPDRFFSGVELIKLKKAPLLIFTGGKVPWRSDAIPEGQFLRRFAISLGVDPNIIMVTGEVQNTFQEAEAVSEMLPDTANILLVTSASHMERAKLIFENSGLGVTPFAVDFKTKHFNRPVTVMDFLPSPVALSKSSKVIREYIGRLYYRLKFVKL